MDSYHSNKSPQKDKGKTKQTSDNSKKHCRILRAGLAIHCILKTHSSSENTIQRHKDLSEILACSVFSMIKLVKAELSLLIYSQTTQLLKVWSIEMEHHRHLGAC